MTNKIKSSLGSLKCLGSEWQLLLQWGWAGDWPAPVSEGWTGRCRAQCLLCVGPQPALLGFMGHKDWMDNCVCLLTTSSEVVSTMSPWHCLKLSVPSACQQTLKQILICGDPQAKDTKALLKCVHSMYIPNKALILAHGDPSSFLFHQLGTRCENKPY